MAAAGAPPVPPPRSPPKFARSRALPPPWRHRRAIIASFTPPPPSPSRLRSASTSTKEPIFPPPSASSAPFLSLEPRGDHNLADSLIPRPPEQPSPSPIWPERRSFPATSCKRKLVGTRYFSGGYEATSDRMNESVELRSSRRRRRPRHLHRLQDRLGFDEPSEAIDWLLKASAAAIAHLLRLQTSRTAAAQSTH